MTVVWVGMQVKEINQSLKTYLLLPLFLIPFSAHRAQVMLPILTSKPTIHVSGPAIISASRALPAVTGPVLASVIE